MTFTLGEAVPNGSGTVANGAVFRARKTAPAADAISDVTVPLIHDRILRDFSVNSL